MKLYTGFSRVDCTPLHGAPLGGYGNAPHRIGNNVLLPVTVSCTAFRDETGTTALMVSQDTCGTEKAHTRQFKKLLCNQFGIPQENIFFSATHTHSGPTEGVYPDIPCHVEWTETRYYPAVLEACGNALRDLSECVIYAGCGTVEKMNFIRRYIGTDDRFLGNWSTGGDPNAHHETDPDTQLQVIRFAREGKKDIYMVNWQAHPCFHCGENRLDISADYPHYLRTVIEQRLDADAVFVQGGAGNLITKGLLSGESYAERGFVSDTGDPDPCRWYGTALAEKVIALVPTLRKLESGAIRTAEKAVELTVDHRRDAEKDICKKIWDVYNSGAQEEAKTLAKASGFAGGPYECRDIYLKSKYGPTDAFPVWAMRIGSLGFAYFPYEMFDTNAMYVRSHSQCAMTFVCELTNEGHSYMPSEVAFLHGGYEVRSCKYIPGMSEKLAAECTDLLNSL